MIKAVLFDMDGTLVDTEYHSILEKVKVLERNGIKMTDELFQKVCGRKLKTTIGEILPDETEEKRQQILDDYYGKKELDDYVALQYPDAGDTLKAVKAKGYRMAVVSTNLHELIDLAMNVTGWKQYFDLVLGLEDVRKTKPDPEVYIKAMKTFNVRPEETVIVEDSRVGLDSAIASGSIVICRKENRYAVNQDGADYYVDALSEIPAILEGLDHESN